MISDEPESINNVISIVIRKSSNRTYKDENISNRGQRTAW